MMRKVALICATLMATAWCQLDERPWTVSFLVIDESGKSLSGWKVGSFKARESELASQCSGLTGVRIPRGSYRYVLTGLF